MRDREIIQRIKDSVDLAVVIGQAIKLRHQGSAWVGLCPFHGERSPSFYVVPSRDFYHCFGCGKHGDIFTWIMERDGLTFQEAIEYWAQSVGINIPWQRERATAEVDLETRLRLVMDVANNFYKENLRVSTKSNNYLKNRNISPSFIGEAGFGYAPDGWELLVRHLKSQNISLELAEQAGLVTRSERGNYIDFLRDRLVIPIFDARGRIIAFGGRAFGDNVPKYLNTRETPLFNKSSTLFGFNKAKGLLRDGALIVEGYFDVLQLHQNGIYQAVASMGTNLTDKHLQQISRFTKKITLCFDGDNAGVSAMEKALKLTLPLGFDVKLLLLPNGEDPDTWCTAMGADAFRELIKQAPDWTNFIINRALEGKDMRRTSERLEALKELTEFLIFLPQNLERRELLASLAHDLRIPLSELDHMVQSRIENKDLDYTGIQAQNIEIDELLKPVVILCFRDAEILNKVMQIPAMWWDALNGAPVLQSLLDSSGDEGNLPPEVLAQLRYLEAKWSAQDEAEKLPDMLFIKLELSFIEREKQTINRQLQEPSVMVDEALQKRLFHMQEKLLQRSRQLRTQLVTMRRGLFAR